MAKKPEKRSEPHRYVPKDLETLERAYAKFLIDPTLTADTIMDRFGVPWSRLDSHITRNDLPNPRKKCNNGATPRGCRTRKVRGHFTGSSTARYGDVQAVQIGSF